MAILVSDGTVKRMRELTSDFGSLIQRKKYLLPVTDMQRWRQLEEMQLSLAYSLVGLCEGILEANVVTASDN